MRRFLRGGSTRNLPTEALAARCNQFIEETSRRSLTRALSLARCFVSRAGMGKGEMALSAYRALARVTHLSGAHAEALDAYLKARKLARGEQPLCARIDRALVDVHMYLGQFEAARQAARRAMAVFTRIGAESDLAQTRVNYANLLHRRDRHRDAEQLYRQAAAYFEANGNALAAARCHYNRANTLVQLFDFAEAEALYRKAQQSYESEGCTLDANDARYGLAWLRMLAGDFHTALSELSSCETIYRNGGDRKGEALCILDRSEAFIGLGLFADGRDAGRLAERRFAKVHLQYESAKASLFRAQAAFAMGARSEARRALDRAMAGFTSEGNQGFLGTAHLLAADIAGTSGPDGRRHLESARSRFARAQLPLWQAVCDLKEASNPARARSAFGRLRRNGAVRKVPHLYAAWQMALGDVMAQRGDLGVARQHWQSAADRLDAVRAQLPPLDLRAAYTRRQVLPHSRLIAAELDRDPVVAAAWSERFKTAGVWSPIPRTGAGQPERQRVEDSLGSLARRVAALAGRVGGRNGERSVANRKTEDRALSALQNHLREELIRLETSRRDATDTIERLVPEIQSISKRLPIVQFHVAEDRIIAFVHDDGATTLHTFEDGPVRVEKAMRRWRYILESELLAERLGGVDVADAERALWSDLGEWLWPPLKVRRECPVVLIVPEGELSNLPWQALTVNGSPLAERHQFVLTPSIRHYQAACGIAVASNRVEIFRGAAERLPHVDHELDVLARLAGSATVTHDPCRRASWPSCGEFRIWHYAGHTIQRSDNSFYSSLMLEDGPLFAVDFRLKSCQVHLAMLASCRAGEQLTMPGEESTGLVRSLLEMGVRNVVAAHWPVTDRTAALWMENFYQRYFDGNDLLDAARHAARVVRGTYPSAYHWAAFSTFGAGG
ncbi:MAG: CHAT domain-containing tetratricopeptide repeat protein [Candidatus Zixiibacteriota bacterium]